MLEHFVKRTKLRVNKNDDILYTYKMFLRSISFVLFNLSNKHIISYIILQTLLSKLRKLDFKADKAAPVFQILSFLHYFAAFKICITLLSNTTQ